MVPPAAQPPTLCGKNPKPPHMPIPKMPRPADWKKTGAQPMMAEPQHDWITHVMQAIEVLRRVWHMSAILAFAQTGSPLRAKRFSDDDEKPLDARLIHVVNMPRSLTGDTSEM
ncbi:hypothetical protein P8C59_003860 [Phyllachora maydis]|uniref:Uncharacterized protein n=1 Tax=Phyllachora maydis TaxID=1825666 RepID=A0AAD9I2A2_9PEZI|nr:hypothetical protein P8C59_003860 [Phyllachora maydis]